MGSKREEERNEKIIRGSSICVHNFLDVCLYDMQWNTDYVSRNVNNLLLIESFPGNLNCDTAIKPGMEAWLSMPAVIFSGEEGLNLFCREFTHRVKSVSMSKFTSQEVDALQKGGNQRARDLFLKAWDPHKLRLTDNSNADKVREFIKNVYVERRYAVEKSSDRPPKDPQGIRSYEDETRRANSYHSYSQSPPYDFQYEERRYGRHAVTLTRKPGSDRGRYGAKFSSFSSPSRFSDHANDEGFANEGSHPRVLEYSASSGSDPFRSGALSASSQGDTGSPFSETSSNFSNKITGHHRVLHNSDAISGSKTRHSQVMFL
ncbi:UNVERIFIED_CONTAM: putative ADP-ribosylation factor GTPase-activating protein AGD14 [Sesamum radiatum]|uniref:ADP-ribosylation factor GTPase-activating protein AGD14 n=1 Tax=Sesamum radiatum TaxID=300843 RepID=A0AAW2LCA6_SESRA